MIFVAAVVIVAALAIFSKLKFLKNTGKEVDGHFRTQKTEDGKIDFVRCPLCSTPLSKGENIRLVIQRNAIDRAVYVGDTQGDLDAADFAGIPFIRAAYGFGQVNRPVPEIPCLPDLPVTISDII